jgi:DNA-binding response OmpR family regulator
VPPEPTSLKVLVADDDAALTRLLTLMIEAQGYGAPTVVHTAGDAMARAVGHDLILLDHVLPDGVGLDLVPMLRRLPGEPAVVLITAHGDEALAAAALRAGADDYLAKDDSMAAILPQVLERVRRHRALRRVLADAEQELLRSARQAAIGQLTVTLHHTLNNPLQVALAEADLLLAEVPGLTEAQRESVGTIRQALGRIQQVLVRVGSLGHDHTTDYLEGVAMIDLARLTREVPLRRGEVVLFLPEEGTARAVRLLLTQAGFLVRRATDAAALERESARPEVTLVIVNGTAAPGADPLGGFRPAADRAFTLMAMVAGSGTAALAAGADHVVSLPFDPATFVDEVLGGMRP